MRRSRGFTLLELLVSVGLLALLVLTLSLVFSQGLKALHIGYNRAEMYASARNALDQMIREIPTAIGDGTASYPFVGLAANSPAKLRGIDSIGPEIYFVGQVAGAGQSDVVELGYWLRPRSGTSAPPNELMRFYVTDTTNGQPNADFELYQTGVLAANFSTPAGSATNSNLLAENIVALEFLYHYRTAPGVWVAPSAAATAWDSRLNNVANVDAQGNPRNPDGLPDAVEVRITVQDKSHKETAKTLRAFISLES